MPIDDGGPAFPRPAVPTYSVRHEPDEADGTVETDFRYDDGSEGSGRHVEEGMSLRDYFAAAALQGAIAHGLFNAEKAAPDYQEFLASVAYGYADAMLAQRTKEPTK